MIEMLFISKVRMVESLQRITFFDNAASRLFVVAFARHAMTRYALAFVFDPADLNCCGRASELIEKPKSSIRQNNIRA